MSNKEIAWLKLTGIQRRMGFKYRNFFIPWVEENPLELVIFGGFFSPWDEEISLVETRSFGNAISIYYYLI